MSLPSNRSGSVRLNSQNLQMLQDWQRGLPSDGMERVPSPTLSSRAPTEVGSVCDTRSVASRRSVACSTASMASMKRSIAQLESDVAAHTTGNRYNDMLATVERLNKQIEARKAAAGTAPTQGPQNPATTKPMRR